MMETLLGAGLFTAIVFLLAVVVLLARSLLLPRGEATLIINDSREFRVASGGRLLESLLANGVFIPSACGGNGSCGQCRVVVQEGGGQLLPIESSFVTRRQAKDGQRLACQVPLRAMETLRMRLPESVFAARRYDCRVRSSRNVATYIREVTLDLPVGETLDFHAGGYMMVECPPYQLSFADIELDDRHRLEWQRYGLLDMQSVATVPSRRAYSLANSPLEGDKAVLNVRLATPPPSAPVDTPPGRVSSWLFGLKPGDPVTLAGPYGDFLVNDSEAEMLFVGGGAGMAPLRSHIVDQLQRVGTGRKISFWYGARSLDEAFYVEEFEELARQHSNFKWYLALSEAKPQDRWQGLSGFIHEVVFKQYLSTHPSPEGCEYYLCGPPMMIAALIDMFDELGVPAQNIYFDDFGS